MGCCEDRPTSPTRWKGTILGGHQPTSLDGGEGPRWGGGLRVGWGRVEVERWRERRRNEDETEGVTHVTHVVTPLPPNDNGRVLCQD